MNILQNSPIIIGEKFPHRINIGEEFDDVGKSTLYRAQIWGRVWQNHQGKVITLHVKHSPTQVICYQTVCGLAHLKVIIINTKTYTLHTI